MFVSFFPRPNLFFLSVLVWTAIAIAGWYIGSDWIGGLLGLSATAETEIVGVQVFWSEPFLLFYLYYVVCVGLFAAFWMVYAPHPWAMWSILGSALILFTTYFQVQVSVALNSWYGPFYDLIQAALGQTRVVTVDEYFGQLLVFAGIAFVAVGVGVLTRFFVQHWIFRWRTAMNTYYMSHWSALRHIEGASQRVQEDTMRFSGTMEGLAVSLVGSVMTLVAFLPVLARLSENVPDLPIIGGVPYALVWVAIIWALVGTGLVALIGIRLPGLEFRNQRVEAAYRKELVYGEDDATRAQPRTVGELFAYVRHNYFRLYLNYLYFNVGRIIYLQTDNIIVYIALAPTIVAGRITFGVFQQIINAFGQVSNSFQYLVNSWTTIVELLSIYKRLRAFEATIHGEALSGIEKEVPVAAE